MALLASAGASANAQPAPVQLVVLSPITISAKSQARIYPEKAKAAHLSGAAIVICSGKDNLRLSGCSVPDETPAGSDFGATAFAIATHLNASHISVNPGSAASVVVHVYFDYPDAPPPNPPVPRNGWEHLPTTSDLTDYYPDVAARFNQEGWAFVRCLVTSDGELSQCKLAAEAPSDFGFGKAALSLSKDYRMKPSAGLSGRTIAFPINFRLPQPER